MADAFATSATFAQLDSLLRSYDLAELIPWAQQMFVEGRSIDEITVGLRQQTAFRTKYSVIFEREAQGLPPITVNEVLEYRTRSRQIERMYGLPDGFVDPNRLMLADVSIDELNFRARAAASYVDTRTDVLNQLQTMYGLDRGAAIAYVLDPDTAEPAIQNTLTTAQVGAAAARSGYGQLSRQEAETLTGLGVNESSAQQGFDAVVAAGELRQTFDGERPIMDRETELGIVAGDQGARRRLQDRQRERQAVFDEGGGFLASREGMTGLGVAR